MNIYLEQMCELDGPFGSMYKASPHEVWFWPEESAQYNPVLLHVNVNNMTVGTLAFIRDTIASEVPCPVLFTDTDDSKSVENFLEWLEATGYDESFNAVLSIANPNVPQGYYATFHKNLPTDLTDYLSWFFQWGVNENKQASRAAETISLALNVTCVSFNYGGDTEDDWEMLLSLIQYIPKYHDWRYIEYQLPETTKQGVCACCEKKRGPQKYFYRIQGNLCPVCEKKIKAIGDVNVINLYKAQIKLMQERVTTRKANIRKQLSELSLACPKCGGGLTYGPNNGLVCKECKSVYFRDKQHLIEGRDNHMLYVYNKTQVVSIKPASSQQLVQYCYSCRKPTINGVRYERPDGTAVILCKNCDWNLKQQKKRNTNKEVTYNV